MAEQSQKRNEKRKELAPARQSSRKPVSTYFEPPKGTCRVFVGTKQHKPFPEWVTKHHLTEHFTSFSSDIINVTIAHGAQDSRFGIVTFTSRAIAEKAIQELDGSMLLKQFSLCLNFFGEKKRSLPVTSSAAPKKPSQTAVACTEAKVATSSTSIPLKSNVPPTSEKPHVNETKPNSRRGRHRKNRSKSASSAPDDNSSPKDHTCKCPVESPLLPLALSDSSILESSSQLSLSSAYSPTLEIASSEPSSPAGSSPAILIKSLSSLVAEEEIKALLVRYGFEMMSCKLYTDTKASGPDSNTTTALVHMKECRNVSEAVTVLDGLKILGECIHVAPFQASDVKPPTTHTVHANLNTAAQAGLGSEVTAQNDSCSKADGESHVDASKVLTTQEKCKSPNLISMPLPSTTPVILRANKTLHMSDYRYDFFIKQFPEDVKQFRERGGKVSYRKGQMIIQAPSRDILDKFVNDVGKTGEVKRYLSPDQWKHVQIANSEDDSYFTELKAVLGSDLSAEVHPSLNEPQVPLVVVGVSDELVKAGNRLDDFLNKDPPLMCMKINIKALQMKALICTQPNLTEDIFQRYRVKVNGLNAQSTYLILKGPPAVISQAKADIVAKVSSVLLKQVEFPYSHILIRSVQKRINKIHAFLLLPDGEENASTAVLLKVHICSLVKDSLEDACQVVKNGPFEKQVVLASSSSEVATVCTELQKKVAVVIKVQESSQNSTLLLIQSYVLEDITLASKKLDKEFNPITRLLRLTSHHRAYLKALLDSTQPQGEGEKLYHSLCDLAVRVEFNSEAEVCLIGVDQAVESAVDQLLSVLHGLHNHEFSYTCDLCFIEQIEQKVLNPIQAEKKNVFYCVEKTQKHKATAGSTPITFSISVFSKNSENFKETCEAMRAVCPYSFSHSIDALPLMRKLLNELAKVASKHGAMIELVSEPEPLLRIHALSKRNAVSCWAEMDIFITSAIKTTKEVRVNVYKAKYIQSKHAEEISEFGQQCDIQLPQLSHKSHSTTSLSICITGNIGIVNKAHKRIKEVSEQCKVEKVTLQCPFKCLSMWRKRWGEFKEEQEEQYDIMMELNCQPPSWSRRDSDQPQFDYDTPVSSKFVIYGHDCEGIEATVQLLREKENGTLVTESTIDLSERKVIILLTALKNKELDPCTKYSICMDINRKARCVKLIAPISWESRLLDAKEEILQFIGDQTQVKYEFICDANSEDGSYFTELKAVLGSDLSAEVHPSLNEPQVPLVVVGVSDELVKAGNRHDDFLNKDLPLMCMKINIKALQMKALICTQPNLTEDIFQRYRVKVNGFNAQSTYLILKGPPAVISQAKADIVAKVSSVLLKQVEFPYPHILIRSVQKRINKIHAFLLLPDGEENASAAVLLKVHICSLVKDSLEDACQVVKNGPFEKQVVLASSSSEVATICTKLQKKVAVVIKVQESSQDSTLLLIQSYVLEDITLASKKLDKEFNPITRLLRLTSHHRAYLKALLDSTQPQGEGEKLYHSLCDLAVRVEFNSEAEVCLIGVDQAVESAVDQILSVLHGLHHDEFSYTCDLCFIEQIEQKVLNPIQAEKKNVFYYVEKTQKHKAAAGSTPITFSISVFSKNSENFKETCEAMRAVCPYSSSHSIDSLPLMRKSLNELAKIASKHGAMIELVSKPEPLLRIHALSKRNAVSCWAEMDNFIKDVSEQCKVEKVTLQCPLKYLSMWRKRWEEFKEEQEEHYDIIIEINCQPLPRPRRGSDQPRPDDTTPASATFVVYGDDHEGIKATIQLLLEKENGKLLAECVFELGERKQIILLTGLKNKELNPCAKYSIYMDINKETRCVKLSAPLSWESRVMDAKEEILQFIDDQSQVKCEFICDDHVVGLVLTSHSFEFCSQLQKTAKDSSIRLQPFRKPQPGFNLWGLKASIEQFKSKVRDLENSHVKPMIGSSQLQVSALELGILCTEKFRHLESRLQEELCCVVCQYPTKRVVKYEACNLSDESELSDQEDTSFLIEQKSKHWFWKDDNGQFMPYPSEVSDALTAMQSTGNYYWVCPENGNRYCIDLTKMEQKNTFTGVTRKVSLQPAKYHWCYLDDHGVSQPYDDALSNQLERIFSQGKDHYASGTHSFDLKLMVMLKPIERPIMREIKAIPAHVPQDNKPKDKGNTERTSLVIIRGPKKNLEQMKSQIRGELKETIITKTLNLPPDSIINFEQNLKRIANDQRGISISIVAKRNGAASSTQAKVVRIEGLQQSVDAVVIKIQDKIIKFQSHSLKASEPQDTPPEWEAQDQTVQLFSVQNYSREWHHVTGLFKQTLPTFRIVSVKRIQNKWLWNKYVHHRAMLHLKNAGRVNEMELFHGTRDTDPEKIFSSDEGFDMRFSREGLWGQANYFAVNASYSNVFAHIRFNREKEIFLAKVLTGASVKCEQNRTLRMPPLMNETDSSIGLQQQRYDTVCGNTQDSVVYMTYSNEKAYPAYLIQYTDGAQPTRQYAHPSASLHQSSQPHVSVSYAPPSVYPPPRNPTPRSQPSQATRAQSQVTGAQSQSQSQATGTQSHSSQATSGQSQVTGGPQQSSSETNNCIIL